MVLSVCRVFESADHCGARQLRNSALLETQLRRLKIEQALTPSRSFKQSFIPCWPAKSPDRAGVYDTCLRMLMSGINPAADQYLRSRVIECANSAVARFRLGCVPGFPSTSAAVLRSSASMWH